MKHFGPISGVSAYKDRYIATAGYDNLIILWDGETKVPLHRVFHDHLANQCTFSPCGRYLVSSSSDYTARLWDVPTLNLRAVYAGHDDDVEMSAFNERGDQVATCSRDHQIRIFDLNGTLRSTLKGHEADVLSVSWTPGGKGLISSSDDGTVRKWDVPSGQLRETVDLEGVETDTIALTEHGVIFAGNDDGDIICIQDGVTRSLPAHQAGIKRLIYDADKHLLASLSYDRTLILWSVDTEANLSKQRISALPGIVWPRSGAFFADHHLVFGTFGSTFATYDYRGDVWNLDDIHPSISLNAATHSRGSTYAIGDAGTLWRDGHQVQHLDTLCNFLLPFGETLLTGGQMGKVFDALSGRVVHQHRSPINCGATFVKAGIPHAIIGTYTGEGLVFCQDRDGDLVHEATIKLHDNAVKGIACSDTTIFSVCADTSVAFHRISDFASQTHIERAHGRIANGCTALPDGRFASIGRDLKLRLWQHETCECFDTPHRNSIKCIASSSDGAWIATASYTGTAAIFEVATKTWRTVQRPTAAGISSLAADVEPGAFTASSYDGNLYRLAVI